MDLPLTPFPQREPPFKLSAKRLPAYLVARGLVPSGEPMTVTPLGGGVSNMILHFASANDCGVVKQARSRIRVARNWVCDIRRVINERDCILLLTPILPAGTVPTIRDSDDPNFAFVMDCAPVEAELWRDQLLDGRIDDGAAARVGRLLQILHSQTADRSEIRDRFEDDALLGQLRIEPFYKTTAEANPDLAHWITLGAERLTSVKQCLVHGDYAPKNLFITPESLLLLDYEIAHYGNPAYDVATCTNHLLLKAFAFPGRRASYFRAAKSFWRAYSNELDPTDRRVLEQESLLQLGCLLLARIDGKSPVGYITTEQTKARVRRVAHAIFTDTCAGIEDVAGLVDVQLEEAND